MFLMLEDGAVFEGRSVGDALECGGLLSFYTGSAGYQEVITDPANLGKIVLFTYPLIGNYGVSGADAESASAKAAGVIVSENASYYSNHRAEGSLQDYLARSGTVHGHGFDTRAILLHLRENGEMKAVTCGERLGEAELAKRFDAIDGPDYEPENRPLPCKDGKVRAAILDLGASKSFFRHLVSLGVKDGFNPNEADLIIVSDAAYYVIEDSGLITQIAAWFGRKPIIGFGHGATIVAKACEGHVGWLKLGDHGTNVPVKCLAGGRNEITTQNHNYAVVPGNGLESLFENLNDGTCEGFKCAKMRAAGANFLPNAAWFDILLKAVGAR